LGSPHFLGTVRTSGFVPALASPDQDRDFHGKVQLPTGNPILVIPRVKSCRPPCLVIFSCIFATVCDREYGRWKNSRCVLPVQLTSSVDLSHHTGLLRLTSLFPFVPRSRARQTSAKYNPSSTRFALLDTELWSDAREPATSFSPQERRKTTRIMMRRLRNLPSYRQDWVFVGYEPPNGVTSLLNTSDSLGLALIARPRTRWFGMGAGHHWNQWAGS